MSLNGTSIGEYVIGSFAFATGVRLPAWAFRGDVVVGVVGFTCRCWASLCMLNEVR